jgi:hypothetical protein
MLWMVMLPETDVTLPRRVCSVAVVMTALLAIAIAETEVGDPIAVIWAAVVVLVIVMLTCLLPRAAAIADVAVRVGSSPLLTMSREPPPPVVDVTTLDAASGVAGRFRWPSVVANATVAMVANMAAIVALVNIVSNSCVQVV